MKLASKAIWMFRKIPNIVRFRSFSRNPVIIAVIGLVFVLAGTPVPAAPVNAASTYFVAKNGSDYNPGTETRPWLTIQKAARTMLPGDTVYVKSGIYREKITPTRSGTSSARISYKVYPGNKVVIDGTGIKTYPNGIFFIYNLSNISIEGFEISNSSDWAGVYLYGTSVSNITLKWLSIHDVWSSGILAVSDWETITSTRMNNIEIDGCHIYRTNFGGDQESISLIGVNNFDVEYNFIHDVQGHQNYSNDKEGIDAKVGSSNGTIHNNEIYKAKIGIYLDANSTASSNISVYNNKIHDCYDIGIGLGSEGAHTSLTGIKVYNNLIYNNTVGFSILNYAFPVSFSLVNNTFYQNGTMQEVYVADSPTVTESEIRNNIIVANARYSYLIYYSRYPEGIIIDKNLYYNPYGYSQNNRLGTNYKLTNPLLADPANINFRLQSDSPAINAGTAVSAPSTDFYGTARPQGTEIDIGATEY